MEREILVTIRCITYNHESYIRQCLDGFIMQKTNFRFEAIVHDDASSDNTPAIIREYAEKYPQIIKPIYETENQYSKHDGSLARIMLSHIRGKYVALCEGDDYWTDPYKLQKQVDFMESHPEYSLCFHNSVVHWQSGEKEDSLFVNANDNRDYSGPEIYKKWTIPTASVVVKSDVFKSRLYLNTIKERRFVYGDIILFITAARCGILHYMNQTMAVYRRQPTGMIYTISFNDKLKRIKHYDAIKEMFGGEYIQISNLFKSYTYYDLHNEYKKRHKMLKMSEYFIKAIVTRFIAYLQSFKHYE